MTAVRRIGLLTGGGDCPGLNAVIWAVVRGAAQQGIEVVGIIDGFEGLVGGPEGCNTRVLHPHDVRQIFRDGGTVLGTTNRGNPFRYATEKNGITTEEDRGNEVVANIAICLIHQANFLLDRLIGRLEQDFVKEGGLRERMTAARLRHRSRGNI